MNRRKFLKMGAGVAAAAAVPSVAIAMHKAQPESPKAIAVDPDYAAAWGASDDTDGYMYSDNMSDSLRRALQQTTPLRALAQN